LVRTDDRPGAVASLDLPFQRFGLDIDLARFESLAPGASCEVLMCSCTQEVVRRLAAEVGSLVDVISVDVASLEAGSGVPPIAETAVGAVSSPRDYDEIMDRLVAEIPLYGEELIERLRRFHVTDDLVGTSPALAREAACHIERLESENLILARLVAGIDGAAT
jgi:hypothetical protein